MDDTNNPLVPLSELYSDSLNECIDNEEESEEAAFSPPSNAKLSLRGAINATCRDCIYDDQAKGEGSWRAQVEKCTVSKCGLYQVRPISKPRKTASLPSE